MKIEFDGYRLSEYADTKDGGMLAVRAHFRVASLADFARLLNGLRSLTDLGQMSASIATTSTAEKKCEPAEAPEPPKDNVAKKREQKKAKAAEPAPPKAEEPPPESEQGEDDEEPEPVTDGKDAASAIVETKEPAVKPKAKFTPKMTDPDARFTDVVVDLYKQGFHDPKDIVALCEKVHEKVPAIKKVKLEELAKRVERTFEIEGLA